MPTRWDVERAVLASKLSPPARHVALTLLTLVDGDTAVIPPEFTPSLSGLEERTGLSRSTVTDKLNELERDGWVRRHRPTVAQARSKKARTRYSLHIGASPGDGLVRDTDQSTSPGGGPVTPPTGPPHGPELVRDTDQTPPLASPPGGLNHPTTTPPITTPSSSAKPTKALTPAPPPRLDVERICTALADRIEANGSRRPTITARWRTEARLLLDRDGRTLDQVLACIAWCQADPFWRSNILSMPKLRERYDQLRLAAARDRPTTHAATGTGPAPAPSRNSLILAAAMERARAAEGKTL